MAGFATMIFGLVALFWPGLTLAVFVLLFGGYVLVAGLIALMRGLLGVAVGVYLVRNPAASFVTVILITGISFIVQGLVDVARGLFTDAESSTARMMGLIAGGLSVAAGVFLLNQPATAGIAFVWIIGLYGLVAGPLMVAAAMDLRKFTAKA